MRARRRRLSVPPHMRGDVQTRIRSRIRDRLAELRMHQRELAQRCGHDDSWITGILAGRQGLHWKDFDTVADVLELTPSDLVRYEDSLMLEVKPTEARLPHSYRQWPASIRVHFAE